MSEAFISYSRADGAFADKLREDLEKRGIGVWIDRENIEGGAAWRAAISTAIRSCCAFILLLSPRSTQSGQVSKELSVAEVHGRLIVPIVLEACDIPPGMELQLAELQWISLTEQSYDAALERLTRVITEAQSRTASAATSDARESSVSVASSTTRPDPSQASSSNGSRPAATAGSSRRWLLAGATAAVVAGGSFGAFQYLQQDSKPPSENAARVDEHTKAAGRSGTVAVPVAAPGDSKVGVVPAVAEASPTRASPRVIGNTRNSQYHLPGCPGYSALRHELRKEFSSVQEAEQAGYRRADNCPASATATVAVVGNSRTLSYALPHCPGYTATREEYRVAFNSVEEAEKAGYRRGEKCS